MDDPLNALRRAEMAKKLVEYRRKIAKFIRLEPSHNGEDMVIIGTSSWGKTDFMFTKEQIANLKWTDDAKEFYRKVEA